MSDILRGEEIGLFQIYFQAESAYSCLSKLGELGIVQFRDVYINDNIFGHKKNF
jgi:V-type H+-transporting ATPase subunit a